MEFHLSIGGGEWVIIALAVLVLVLGTNKLPQAARKLGRAASEYGRARDEIAGRSGGGAGGPVNVTGPVEDERQKFEAIARSLNIDPAGKDTDELRRIIGDAVSRGGDQPP